MSQYCSHSAKPFIVSGCACCQYFRYVAFHKAFHKRTGYGLCRILSFLLLLYYNFSISFFIRPDTFMTIASVSQRKFSTTKLLSDSECEEQCVRLPVISLLRKKGIEKTPFILLSDMKDSSGHSP